MCVRVHVLQREGVKFGIRHRGRVLIGDEMGLGKTLQGMAIAYRYKDAWPMLVVAPASMTSAWSNEFEEVSMPRSPATSV